MQKVPDDAALEGEGLVAEGRSLELLVLLGYVIEVSGLLVEIGEVGLEEFGGLGEVAFGLGVDVAQFGEDGVADAVASVVPIAVGLIDPNRQSVGLADLGGVAAAESENGAHQAQGGAEGAAPGEGGEAVAAAASGEVV